LGSFRRFAFLCFFPLFKKRCLLVCQPGIERPIPEVSFALQSLFGAVSAVGGFGFAEILEDGRVAVERKKEALSAPTVLWQLCPNAAQTPQSAAAAGNTNC
jgi:hypothetical protein